jgi:hypothetical protein
VGRIPRRVVGEGARKSRTSRYAANRTAAEHLLAMTKACPPLSPPLCLPTIVAGMANRFGGLSLLSNNCGDLGRGLSYSSGCQAFIVSRPTARGGAE